MKIELKDKKVFFKEGEIKKEIHPFWLRERVNGDIFVDKKTQQRLFDPTDLKGNIEITNLNLSNNFLEVTFNDGAITKIATQNICQQKEGPFEPRWDENMHQEKKNCPW